MRCSEWQAGQVEWFAGGGGACSAASRELLVVGFVSGGPRHGMLRLALAMFCWLAPVGTAANCQASLLPQCGILVPPPPSGTVAIAIDSFCVELNPIKSITNTTTTNTPNKLNKRQEQQTQFSLASTVVLGEGGCVLCQRPRAIGCWHS